MASLVCCTAISCGNNNAAGNDIDDKSTVSDSLNSTLSSAEATEGFMNDELILNGSVTCDESKVSKVLTISPSMRAYGVITCILPTVVCVASLVAGAPS